MYGHSSDWRNVSNEIKVAELFAGVGGFRLGLEGYGDPERPEYDMAAAGPFKTIWANQWEPGTDARQFAARCYRTRFGEEELVNRDISAVMDDAEAGALDIPDVDMVVGGFPCQDYSVARPLSQSRGIEGKKGVLWWEIYRFLHLKQPRFALFENVDRLLKSPAKQRGRDFAIILSCLAEVGYAAQWRVVNSAEYGCSQRRKRVYIFCERADGAGADNPADLIAGGVLAAAFPAKFGDIAEFEVPADPYDASETFGVGAKASAFLEAGAMFGGRVATCRTAEEYDGPRRTLGDVLVPEGDVPERFFIEADKMGRWEYLKGSKSERRVDKRTGYEYTYSEGAMSFPDPTASPSRTILTGEGGTGPSRFKHVVECPSGRLRRLVPDELDRLQGFPAGWTDTGMTEAQRAFCMGNALVTDVVHRIGEAMCEVYSL